MLFDFIVLMCFGFIGFRQTFTYPLPQFSGQVFPQFYQTTCEATCRNPEAFSCVDGVTFRLFICSTM